MLRRRALAFRDGFIRDAVMPKNCRNHLLVGPPGGSAVAWNAQKSSRQKEKIITDLGSISSQLEAEGQLLKADHCSPETEKRKINEHH